MALTNRQQLALGNWGVAPAWFKHTPPPNQPTIPSRAYLGTGIDRINVETWLQKRAAGTISSQDTAGFSQNALNATAQLEAFFATPAWLAWANLNLASRDSQWRLYRADVHTQTQFPGAAVLPISADPTGVGANNASIALPSTNPQLRVFKNVFDLSIDAASTDSGSLYSVGANQTLYIERLTVSCYFPTASTQFLFDWYWKITGNISQFDIWSLYISDNCGQGNCPTFTIDYNGNPIPVAGNVNVTFPAIKFTRKSAGSTGALASFNLAGYIE